MITKDFYGNNFVWWVGRVEDRKSDPLKLGAVRVRIFGLHSDDEQLVPIDSLPWAQVMSSPNSIKSFSVPRRGDWVLGFFQDGANGQIPVVMGVFNGMESSYSLLNDQPVSNTPQTSSPEQTEPDESGETQVTPPVAALQSETPASNLNFDEEINSVGTTTEFTPINIVSSSEDGENEQSAEDGESGSTNSLFPIPPPGIIVRELNRPLNSRISREILDGTLINKVNNELSKACDITAIIDYGTAQMKIAFSSVMQKIRDAIRAFLISLGFGDPSGEVRKVIQEAKEVLAEIKRIKKVFDEVREWIALIPRLIQRIREFIQFIQSLPQRFINLIMQCMNSILSAITSGIRGLVNVPGLQIVSELRNDVNSIINSVTSLSSEIRSSVSSTTQALRDVPANFSSVLLQPTLDNLRTGTTVHLNNLIKSFPTPDEVKKQTSFDTFSTSSNNLGP